MKRLWLLSIAAAALLLGGCVKKLPDGPPAGPTPMEEKRSKSENEPSPAPKGAPAAGLAGGRSTSENEPSPAGGTPAPQQMGGRSTSESQPSPAPGK